MESISKIGIICASEDELEPFLIHLKNKIETKKALLTFIEGTYKTSKLILVFSGVCKVNSAIATQILIDSFKVGLVINAGTAGGIDESVALFDTVISSQVTYHDVADDILTEYHPFMKTIYFDIKDTLLEKAKIIAKDNKTIHIGIMVTGECFVEDNKRDYIKNKFHPLSVDMESASVAHVCYVNNILFISIRAITDTFDHKGLAKFEENCKEASMVSKDIVLSFIDSLL